MNGIKKKRQLYGIFVPERRTIMTTRVTVVPVEAEIGGPKMYFCYCTTVYVSKKAYSIVSVFGGFFIVLKNLAKPRGFHFSVLFPVDLWVWCFPLSSKF